MKHYGSNEPMNSGFDWNAEQFAQQSETTKRVLGLIALMPERFSTVSPQMWFELPQLRGFLPDAKSAEAMHTKMVLVGFGAYAIALAPTLRAEALREVLSSPLVGEWRRWWQATVNGDAGPIGRFGLPNFNSPLAWGLRPLSQVLAWAALLSGQPISVLANESDETDAFDYARLYGFLHICGAQWQAYLARIDREAATHLALQALDIALEAPIPEVELWWQLALQACTPECEESFEWRPLAAHAVMREDELAIARLPQDLQDNAHALKGVLRLGFEGAFEILEQELGHARLQPWFTFWLCGLAARGADSDLALIKSLRKGRSESDALLERVDSFIECERKAEPYVSRRGPVNDLWCVFFDALALHWQQRSLSANHLASLRELASTWRAQGWHWCAEQADALATGAVPQRESLLLWRRAEAPWQRQLRAMERAVGLPATGDAAQPVQEARLAVFVDHRTSPANISVKWQKLGKKGVYLGGSVVDSFRAEGVMLQLGPNAHHERRILAALISAVGRREIGVFKALVGYPHVYWDGWVPHANARAANGRIEPKSVQVELAQPQVHVDEEADGQVTFRIEPALCKQPLQTVAREQTLLVYEFTDEVQRLSAILENKAIVSFPPQAVAQVMRLVPALARQMSVVNTLSARTAEPMDSDARIHVQIESMAVGLRFRLRARPLGEHGIFCMAGQPPRRLIGLRAGLPVVTERELAVEAAALDRLLADLPQLEGAETSDWLPIGDPELALETLLALQAGAMERPLHWSSAPQSIVRQANVMSVRVKAKQDWFQAEGTLALEDGEVLSLAQLLECLPSTQSRFLRLSNDRLVVISSALMRQLQLMKAIGGGKQQFAATAVIGLQALIEDGVELSLDSKVHDFLGKLQAAHASEPTLPDAFIADLRDYQLDGVRWLLRLVQWAPGACLADDMGLGKTLQALALLTARASLGPQLVVAPTSVVANWRHEARRFAPSLNVQVLSEGPRADILAALAPGSVLLLSYGLLVIEIESLCKHRFATAVFDEAQVLKNSGTQRSEAAGRVKRDFALLLSGTPMENHLLDLWSLLNLAVPGLLGGPHQFRDRFVVPMESNVRAPQRDALRRVIAPLLLRRTKSQVLDELPPRTEIVLKIEPSAEEARFLVALRRQSLERIQSAAIPAADKRFFVLAELTRLRRAACHPSLVAPELNLPGCKLAQLVELLQELKVNRHRTLVFSQFVDFLLIVRRALEAAGISYQYLDGSTVARARQAAVEAFQAGTGDCFLLSLKAGGLGLNLTAADYVIHLDPWWNPAVEQQATDRAHRIGQQRPVTVYKLVMQGSIEEQILALHGEKRALIDSVLADTADTSRLSVDELIAMLAMDPAA